MAARMAVLSLSGFQEEKLGDGGKSPGDGGAGARRSRARHGDEQAAGGHRDVASGDELAVDVGDDRIDADRRSRPDRGKPLRPLPHPGRGSTSA